MLTGKRVLVTGAATGIGAATSRYLLVQGASVFGVGLDAVDGQALAQDCAPSPFVFHEADLTREADVQTAITAAVQRFGGLDAVVNAAGIYPTGKRLHELNDTEWQHTLDVNLAAIFRVCRATLPVLSDAGGGTVVNVASVHAHATVSGVPAYAASKGAVVALSRQMALDYARDRIRVNALIVGSVATRMTLDAVEEAGGAEALGLTFSKDQIGRIAEPSEVASVVGFLISDASSFMTGSALQADGGLLSRLTLG